MLVVTTQELLAVIALADLVNGCQGVDGHLLSVS